MDLTANRRDLLLASLVAALPVGMMEAAASPLDPTHNHHQAAERARLESQSQQPAEEFRFLPTGGRHHGAGPLFHAGALVAGLYERAAHLYQRPAVHGRVGHLVVQQRAGLRPCRMRARAGRSHVRRVAGTPHYDGVIRGHGEPAIIAICGMGPVNYRLVDPVEAGLAARLALQRLAGDDVGLERLGPPCWVSARRAFTTSPIDTRPRSSPRCKHRHVAEAAAGHHAHDLVDRIVGRAAHDIARHDLAHLHVEGRHAVLRHGAHEIAFGGDARDLPRCRAGPARSRCGGC